MKKFFVFALAVVAICSCADKGTSKKEVSAEQDGFQKITQPVSVEDEQDLKSEIAERALFLCKYIPDHGIRENADKYMTKEYYRAYTEALNAPSSSLDIGDEDFLYYFVTNSEAKPVFSINYPDRFVDIIDDTHAKVKVKVAEGESVRISELVIEKVDGQWVISDFDETKASCLAYISEMRSEYDSGEAENQLRMQGASEDVIENFYNSLEEFYKEYGK